MRVLVTGGTGFLGKVLVRKILEQKDWTIRLLVRDTRKVRGLDPSRIEIVRGNMRDEGCLHVAVQDVDIIFHLATAMNGTWNDYYQETVIGTEHFIQAALKAKVRRFVYVSSIGVLEVSRYHEIIDEKTPYESDWLTNYTRSKIMAENIVLKSIDKFNLDGVIVRPGVIFGPGGSILLPRMGFRFGSLFVLVGWKDIPIPTIFVDHAADALVLAAEKGKTGEIYHALDDEPVFKWKYARFLKMHWNSKMKTLCIPYPSARLINLTTKWLSKVHWIFGKIHNAFPMMHLWTSSKAICYSNSKIKIALGWRQADPTQVTLERTVRSYAGRVS